MFQLAPFPFQSSLHIWNSLLKISRRNDNWEGCLLKPLKDFISEHRAVPHWRLSLHRIFSIPSYVDATRTGMA